MLSANSEGAPVVTLQFAQILNIHTSGHIRSPSPAEEAPIGN
jgi:hypothetical protein